MHNALVTLLAVALLAGLSATGLATTGLAAADGATAAASATSAAAALLPDLAVDLKPGERLACDGTWNGQPFWARLLPRDPAYGNHHVLQIVYTPPAPADLGGITLSDCPFVLLDDHGLVVAWNGRDSESQVLPSVAGYKVMREGAVSATTAAVTATRRTIPGDRGFDLHLAPLQLAFAWHPGAKAHVRVVDLFGPRANEALSADWDGVRATIAGTALTVEADGDGRVHRLTDAAGHDVLVITRWSVDTLDPASKAAPVSATGVTTAAPVPAGSTTGAASAP